MRAIVAAWSCLGQTVLGKGSKCKQGRRLSMLFPCKAIIFATAVCHVRTWCQAAAWRGHPIAAVSTGLPHEERGSDKMTGERDLWRCACLFMFGGSNVFGEGGCTCTPQVHYYPGDSPRGSSSRPWWHAEPPMACRCWPPIYVAPCGTRAFAFFIRRLGIDCSTHGQSVTGQVVGPAFGSIWNNWHCEGALVRVASRQAGRVCTASCLVQRLKSPFLKA